MAADTIVATVTLKADGAVKDLTNLGKRAKETDRALGEAGRSGQTSGRALTASTGEAGRSASAASRGFADMSKGVRGVSNSLATFGIAAGVVGTATAWIFSAANAASKLNEQVNGAKVTFGSASGLVRDFSKTTADGLGISASAALKASNQFGAFFKQAGFAEQASAKMSTTLVQLAGDLASFKDVSTDDAIGAISSGLAGESEPLRRLGVDLRSSKVDAEALASGFANTKNEISETDRTTARYVSLLKQTNDAQGDAARTANSYANAQRRLNATKEDFKANLGAKLTDGASRSLSGLNDIFKAINERSFEPLLYKGKGVEEADRLTAAQDRYKAALVGSGAGSAAAASALADLRLANDEAEKKVAALGLSSETTVQSILREADASRQAAGTLRSFVDSQRSLEDAQERTLSTRRAVADAEAKLGDLRRKGKVDADKVADAERGIVSASRSLFDARRSLVKVEEEIAKLRAGPTQDESFDANSAVTGGQIDLDRARRRKEDADRAVALSGRLNPRDRADAFIEQRSAELGLAQATENLSRAEEKRDELNARAGDHSKESIDLEGQLESARLRVDGATDALAAAERTAREARAGDPDFERNLAGAVQGVADAKRKVVEADEDLPFAADAAKSAQEKLNLTLRLGAADADALQKNLGLVNDRYLNMAGFVRGADGTARIPKFSLDAAGPNGNQRLEGRALGGTVDAGRAYLVGEEGPEVLRMASRSGVISPSGASSSGYAGGASTNTSVAINVAAPLDANVAAKIEYGARLASWELSKKGRP